MSTEFVLFDTHERPTGMLSDDGPQNGGVRCVPKGGSVKQCAISPRFFLEYVLKQSLRLECHFRGNVSHQGNR